MRNYTVIGTFIIVHIHSYHSKACGHMGQAEFLFHHWLCRGRLDQVQICCTSVCGWTARRRRQVSHECCCFNVHHLITSLLHCFISHGR